MLRLELPPPLPPSAAAPLPSFPVPPPPPADSSFRTWKRAQQDTIQTAFAVFRNDHFDLMIDAGMNYL